VILELGGRPVELGWKEAAVLLALRWVKTGALSLSALSAIEPDYGRLRALVERLEGLQLVGAVRVGRGVLVYLTGRGAAAAEELERKAVELGLIRGPATPATA
jgi:hypothetical protein